MRLALLVVVVAVLVLLLPTLLRRLPPPAPPPPPPPAPPPAPWRDGDPQPSAEQLAATLEARGRTPTQARLRRRFLRFVPIRRGARVLEVGCGTGVVLRDVAALVGRRGAVVGVDPSRVILALARRLCRPAPGGAGGGPRAGR